MRAKRSIAPTFKPTGSRHIYMTDHDVKGLMQDMQPAFTKLEPYTLTVDEVEVCYLAMCRLMEIEQAVKAMDNDYLHKLLGIDR